MKTKRSVSDKVEFGRSGATLSNNNMRNWEIEICPMSYTRNGATIADNAFARIVANDTGEKISKPFAVSSYSPLTNKLFLETIENAIGGAGHTLELIGTVAGRSKRFASFSLTGLANFSAGERTFESSIYFGDGLDQKTVWFYGYTTRCIQCMNRFSMSLRGASSREKHTSGLLVRLPEIARIIDEAIGVQAEFAAAFNSLAQRPVTLESAKNVFTGFLAPSATERLSTRTENTVDELVTLFGQGRGNRGESRADLFSAVTDFYTHSSVSGRLSVDRATRQFESSEFGNGARRKNDMWSLVNDDESMVVAEARGAAVLALVEA